MYLVLNDTREDDFDPTNYVDCLTVSLVRARCYIVSNARAVA
jgi:hypothetical protein